MCFPRQRQAPPGRGSLGISRDNLLAIVDVLVQAAALTRLEIHKCDLDFDENKITIGLHKYLQFVLDECQFMHFAFLLEASLNNVNGDLGKIEGRIDLKVIFQEHLRPDDYYFGIECKRLRPGDGDTFRYYVDTGVGKYADGTYSTDHPAAMLVGYLMEPFDDPAEARLSDRIVRKYRGATPLDTWPDRSYSAAALVAGDVPRAGGKPIRLLHAMLPMHR